jgi:prepilin peptidase CpaA
MSVRGFHFLILTLVACVAVIAAISDLRWRRIPNALTLPAVILGISLHTLRSGWEGLAFSLWGMAIGGSVLLFFYILGGMGAGDVKLMAGIGALAGTRLVLSVLVLTAIAGGIMAIGKLIVRYRKPYQVKKMVDQAGTHADTVAGEIHETRHAGGSPMKETIPYGVAIAAGTLLSLIFVMVSGGSS